MSAAARAVKVTILGRQYAFASQGEEADAHIRHVADLIDERMREVSRRAPRQPPLQVAVLAGLELADELLRLRREADSVEERIVERTSRLSASLGQLLGDADADTVQDSSSATDFDAARLREDDATPPPRFGNAAVDHPAPGTDTGPPPS